MKINKVNNFDPFLHNEANGIYLHKDNSGHLVVTVNGSDGNIGGSASTMTHQEVYDLIVETNKVISSIKLVSTIAERDSLTLDKDTLVLVIDATEDPTVDSGGAGYLYIYGDGVYAKFFETEGLDIELLWDNIIGRPLSSPEDIDNTVSLKHEHSNKAVLDKLSVNEIGQLTLDDKAVSDSEPLHPFFFS